MLVLIRCVGFVGEVTVDKRVLDDLVIDRDSVPVLTIGIAGQRVGSASVHLEPDGRVVAEVTVPEPEPEGVPVIDVWGGETVIRSGVLHITGGAVRAVTYTPEPAWTADRLAEVGIR